VLLPELIRGFVEYRLVLYGSLLLLSVYFLPRGVVGALSRRRDIGPPTASPVARPRPGRTLAGTEHPVRTRADAQPWALALHGVGKAFGGVRAVADVTFRVKAGTVHSLIGPNGAGKTTVVNLVSGFDAPDAGTIMLFGDAIAGRTPSGIARRGLVRTFQTPQLFEELSTLDNVLVGAVGQRLGSIGLALGGLGGDTATTRARGDEALDAVGLTPWAYTPAAELPFGHRRRVEIARALAAGARVLMLDEPAAGLAPAEVEALDALLSRLRTGGMTVVLVEHHVELVMAISDRVTVLDEGRVIADGAPDAVQRDPAVVAAYLGTSA
jgi:branched-chain amino acid transport system ATP-binding protein/branched-chain amino acid transport system permease protein